MAGPDDARSRPAPDEGGGGGAGPGRPARRLPPAAVAAVCALAAVVLFVGTVLMYGRRELFNADRFTARALDVVHDDVVADGIARALSRQAVEVAAPDLVAVRPLIEGTTSSLIGSGALDKVLRTALGETHRSLFSREGGPIALRLSDAVVLVRGVVAATNPSAARRIPASATSASVEIADRSDTVWVERADTVRSLGLALPLVALAAIGLAALLARDRRRAVVAAGVAVASAGVLVVAAVSVARPLLLGRLDGDAADIAAAAWDGLVGDLGRWGLLLVAAGVVTAAAGASVLPDVDVGGALRRLRERVTAPPAGRHATAVRVARAAGVVVAGALVVADPLAAVRVVALVAGATAVAWGVSEILRLGARPRHEAPAASDAPAPRRVAAAAWVAGGLAAAGLVGLGVAAVATGGGDVAVAAAGPRTCNGHEELCDRRVDEVAFATSHNAMSVAEDPGWFNAHHYNRVTDQLDAGVRGLLVDTHLGQASERAGFAGTRLVRTDLSGEGRDEVVAEIGPQAVAAAERLAGSVLYGRGVEDPVLYMCHALCEIGATRAEDAFREVARWLADHPDEVVVIVIQDEAGPAADVPVLERSGLAARAWPERVTRGRPLPTLRQMIDAGRTALVMHESPGTAGTPDWYQDAYAVTQETPYAFKDVPAIGADASCRPNRGPADAPLLLMNHWLAAQPVLVREAAAANARAVLLDRARACARVRGRPVNLVAVNFVEVGDLYAVVDALNGVAAPAAPAPPG